jgi:signal transduction histidine kinase
LSGFGVVAIINERAAVEKRLEGLWAGRLAMVEDELKRRFEQAEGLATDSGLALSSAGAAMNETGFVVEHGQVRGADARLAAAMTGLGPELQSVPERPVVFSIATGQGTLLVATMRVGERIVGCQVSERAVDELLARAQAAQSEGELGRFALVPVQREVPQGVLARFVSGVTEVREAALGPKELASVTMSRPLQDFRLVAFALGEDPVAQTSTRNRILYSVLLGVFYITLALGVIYTGRTLYREARLSRIKTDFVSLVSHELRTPLTSIRLFIEMLALGQVKEPAEMQKVFVLLSKETTRLSAMIEAVLDWSRIESGKKRYALEVVSVAQLVEATVGSFRTQRMGAAMNFTVEIEAGLPEVAVDRKAIEGALLNLLHNAFKYTREGDKQISLRVWLEGQEIIFEVQDNGVGIARADQRRIFERFYRVDNLLTRVTEGSGLGLAIAQRIVIAHGGRITVKSAVDRGSTFRIHLPVPHS